MIDKNLQETCKHLDIEVTEKHGKLLFVVSKTPPSEVIERVLSLVPKGIEAYFMEGPRLSTGQAMSTLLESIHHFNPLYISSDRVLIISNPHITEEIPEEWWEDFHKVIKGDLFFSGYSVKFGNKNCQTTREWNRKEESEPTESQEDFLRNLSKITDGYHGQGKTETVQKILTGKSKKDKPDRETIITKDEVTDLRIILNSSADVLEVLEKLK